MISFTVAKKYARALLEIGREQGDYEALGRELARWADLVQANKELRSVLFSPVYPASTRKGIAQALSESLSFSHTLRDFMALLIDRNRMDHLFEINNNYRELSDMLAGRMRATLISADQLPERLVEGIRSRLGSVIGREVILSVQEDPSLIGGVLTKIGHVIYDGTMRTQIQKMKESLYKLDL